MGHDERGIKAQAERDQAHLGKSAGDQGKQKEDKWKSGGPIEEHAKDQGDQQHDQRPAGADGERMQDHPKRHAAKAATNA